MGAAVMDVIFKLEISQRLDVCQHCYFIPSNLSEWVRRDLQIILDEFYNVSNLNQSIIV